MDEEEELRVSLHCFDNHLHVSMLKSHIITFGDRGADVCNDPHARSDVEYQRFGASFMTHTRSGQHFHESS